MVWVGVLFGVFWICAVLGVVFLWVCFGFLGIVLLLLVGFRVFLGFLCVRGLGFRWGDLWCFVGLLVWGGLVCLLLLMLLFVLGFL